jgi:hypothetical protein
MQNEMKFRTDAEIRSEVTNRLKRRSLLLLNGGLGVLAVFLLYQFTRFRSFGEPWATLILFFMLGWFVLVILHTAAVVYVELRERLVRSAIERERQFYLLRDNYEKQKRTEIREHDYGASRLGISDDGELIDYPETQKVKAGYHDES